MPNNSFVMIKCNHRDVVQSMHKLLKIACRYLPSDKNIIRLKNLWHVWHLGSDCKSAIFNRTDPFSGVCLFCISV